MSIWGMIVGGAAGFASGGPLGALLGAAAGHAVHRLADIAAAGGDEPEGPVESPVPATDRTRSIAFTIGVIALGAKMAKADGAVTGDEVAAFNEVFRVPPDEARNVERVFNLARRDSRGFEPYARQIAAMFRDRPAVLEELLDCLFHIAKADGTLHEAELTYLRTVARIFGFTDSAFERIRAGEEGPDGGDPYSILGVARTDDAETIKVAWRKLVRENHPDRLIAEGMPQEFIDIATEKVATINAAYDRIARERSIT